MVHRGIDLWPWMNLANGHRWTTTRACFIPENKDSWRLVSRAVAERENNRWVGIDECGGLRSPSCWSLFWALCQSTYGLVNPCLWNVLSMLQTHLCVVILLWVLWCLFLMDILSESLTPFSVSRHFWKNYREVGFKFKTRTYFSMTRGLLKRRRRAHLLTHERLLCVV